MGKRDSAQFLSWAKDRYARNGPGRVPVEWLAPESLQDKVFTFASDIWALAILMWEVFSFGATPYAGLTAVNTAISIGIGKRLPQPSSCPSMLYSMMLQMWQLDLKARLTIEEVLETLNDHLLLVEACRSELVCSAPVCSDSDNSPVSSPRYSAGSQRSSRCSALPKFSRHSSQLLAIGEEEVPVVAGRSSVNGLVAPDRHRNLGDTPGAEAPVGQPGHKASPHPEHDGASETIAFVEELDSPADTEAPVRPEGTRRKHRKSWTSALKRSAKIRGDQDGATKHRMPRRQRHSMATVAFNGEQRLSTFHSRSPGLSPHWHSWGGRAVAQPWWAGGRFPAHPHAPSGIVQLTGEPCAPQSTWSVPAHRWSVAIRLPPSTNPKRRQLNINLRRRLRGLLFAGDLPHTLVSA